MGTYKTWNDFFSGRKTHTETENNIDKFEHDYKSKYGHWFDHDNLKYIQMYGSEKANEIMKKRVDAMYKEKKENERKRYDWRPVTDKDFVPF
ncbi:MAG: hypothetical protein NC433_02945 [Clostridiales bacterium]|nr:hypothetical protein [Clostridiales bacterium]